MYVLSRSVPCMLCFAAQLLTFMSSDNPGTQLQADQSDLDPRIPCKRSFSRPEVAI